MPKRIEHKLVSNIEFKYCCRCDGWYPVNDFYKDISTWDLLDCICIKCEKKRLKVWRKTNPEKARQRDRNYRKANPEKIKRCTDTWKRANLDKVKQYNKEWEKDNIENRTQSRKKWRAANPEKKKVIDKRYMIKYLSTLKGNVSHKISGVMRRSLKNGKKDNHWENIVGYTTDQLIKSLKKTMPYGYTWQDYLNGDLHIDHKIPISVHNYEKIEDDDFLKCWALSNLQLLPAIENISKNSKIEKHFQPSLIFGDSG